MATNAASAGRYSTVAIAFHWVIAVLIALNFAAVWVSHTMPKPERMQIMGNHKAFGLTILALSVLRILWRVSHRAPDFEDSLKSWEVALARTVQALFYFLMIAIPLTGWGIVSAYSGEVVSWFGLFGVPPLPLAQGKVAGGTLHEIHGNLATLMIGLFALHAAGALKHQFLDRDGTLGRMVPWFARS